MGIWGSPVGVSISEVGRNKVLISFKYKRKGLQILKNGPWSIRGNLINLKVWIQNVAIGEVDHTFLEFWIQFHGVLLEFTNKEKARKIGELLEIVEELEDPIRENVLARTFLRVRTAINVNRELATGFWMERDALPPTWIHFKYERLQDAYCMNCGIISHGKRECKILLLW
ncbi:hypothetical protein Ahy_B02g060896 [Arachis hypogaea]|uniref:CCHC-type domain-containing protein n=1 Tax=Arachis hypogaea TaxID=3818 RepID=A0A445AJR7_ARAHY|nr:hypothetical protein Ahy_B02g060896 [Arachis hypogaea]